jgi:hypothetical protein
VGPLCPTHPVLQGDTFDAYFFSVIGRATKEGLLQLADKLKKVYVILPVKFEIKFYDGIQRPQSVGQKSHMLQVWS